MPSFRCIFFTTLQVLIHASLLLAPLWISGVLHGSDSMMTQVPGALDPADNITNVGFGLKHFSVNGTEDITFSHDQEDAYGDQHMAAKVIYYLLRAFMFIALTTPLLMATVRRRWFQIDGRMIISRLIGSTVKVTIPLMVLFTVLMAVPFVLLSRSNLCGPDYIELHYEAEASSDSSSEDEWDDHCQNFEGTTAIVHEGVDATCELGVSGVGTAALLCIWPFVMVAQAFYLNAKAKRLEQDVQNDDAVVEAPVIEVYNTNDIKEDDVTVDSNMDGDTIDSTKMHGAEYP